MKSVKNVDEYIKNAPENVQEKLNELRKTIKETCPLAVEGISYEMAGFKYLGRPLIYFAPWKNHIGIYALPANIEEYKDDLKDYVTSKGTIQIPLDQKLPLALIKKLVKSQMQKIEAEKKP